MAEEWQLDAIRAEIGDEESSGLDDGAVEDLIDTLGSVEAASLRVLKQRHANLLNSPASFSVTGYSENSTRTIESLEAKIAALTSSDAVTGETDIVTTVRATRSDRCGR